MADPSAFNVQPDVRDVIPSRVRFISDLAVYREARTAEALRADAGSLGFVGRSRAESGLHPVGFAGTIK